MPWRWVNLFSSMALGGCLFPAPTEEVPRPTNQPPRILLDSLFPNPHDGPVFMSTRCEPYEFFARLTDPDATDTLYWKVFFDYHRDARVLEREIFTVTLDPLDLAPIVSFLVDPSDSRFTAFARTSQPHTIELLVSDRPFYTDQRIPLGRAVFQEGEQDYYSWTAKIEDILCTDVP